MPLGNTADRYGTVAQTLHWATFLLLLGSFGLGLWMVELSLSPQKLKLISYHKWIGVTVFLLALVRLAWRLYSPPPPLPASVPAWQQRAASAVHGLIYGLLLAVPVTGWLGSSAKGIPTVYLGLIRLPDLIGKDPELAEQLFRLHWVLNKTLLVAVSVHVAAALKHHLVDRDEVLARMLPARLSRR
ncbi:cytochrome b [Pelomicrobium methylotrophicum]|uniref:Cytochrome b n=1 Tax=Pelomicrobium methylotrophicum TaxID=2602750 RepID=A0A5C7EZ56_9PROT|nr:cytochrome b [Pelomicrobium methylotrophicum]TXF12398.1 cytochrome b [Pelomicrobium methylotrophicum]